MDIGYLSDNHLLISSYGVFAVFPQEACGEVVLGEGQFSVGQQNQTPKMLAIRDAIRKFERVLGVRVQPVMLYRDLHESLHPCELHLHGRLNWQLGQVKILSWAGLKPHLNSLMQWQISGAEVQKVYSRYKELRSKNMV